MIFLITEPEVGNSSALPDEEKDGQRALYTTVTLFVTLLLFLYYAILHKLQAVVIQQVIALLFANYIYIAAGYVFITNQSTITKYPGLLSLIPTFMDLKGNLEISQAARFSTISNTTEKDWKNQWPVIRDNIAYRQFFVTIISIMAVGISSIYVHLSNKGLTLHNFMVMLAICLMTATVCCTVLGTLLMFMYGCFSQIGQDPADFSTAMASAIGDSLTILIIAGFAHLFRDTRNVTLICWICIGFVLLIFPLTIYFLFQYPDTCSRMKQLSPALMIATLISLSAGFLFETMNEQYPLIPLFSPLFNGYAGNSISIISNVLATHLTYYSRIRGRHQSKKVKTCLGFRGIFVDYEHSWRLSMICHSHLFYIAMPFQCAMILLMRVLFGKEFIIITPFIVIIYSMLTFLLILVMIVITVNSVHVCHNREIESEETVIPVITSVADFFGTICLIGMFKVLEMIEDPNSDFRGKTETPIVLAATPDISLCLTCSTSISG